MAGRVFDDNGGVWSSTAADFRSTFATHELNETSGDYAVRAFGFVIVDNFGGILQIRLAPAVVSANALTQAFDWLKTVKINRLSVACYSDGWIFEMVPSLHGAAAHIYEKIARSNHRTPEPVMWRKTDPADLTGNGRLSRLLSEWRQIVGESAQIDPVMMAARHLGNRYVVAKRRGDIDALVFDAIGSGFSYYGAQWAQSSIGLPMDAQPDAVYGAWVAQSYREATFRGEPIVHDVDALIRPRNGTQARLRIRRVVLPMLNCGVIETVFGGSFYDDKVELRGVGIIESPEFAGADLAVRLRKASRQIPATRAS